MSKQHRLQQLQQKIAAEMITDLHNPTFFDLCEKIYIFIPQNILDKINQYNTQKIFKNIPISIVVFCPNFFVRIRRRTETF